MSIQLKLLLAVLLGASITWTVHGFFFSEAWTKRQELQQDIEAVEADNQRLKEQIAETERKIEAIDQEPEAQKALVREELGYIGQDEVMVELPTTGTNEAGE